MDEEHADITPEASGELESLDASPESELAGATAPEFAPEPLETDADTEVPAEEVLEDAEEPGETPTAVGEPPAEPFVVPPAAEEKPSGGFLQRAFRWTASLLIVFGLGFVLALFTFYLPTTRQLDRVRSELQAANERIAELNARIDSLSALEAENETLEAELQDARLHVHILSALADVRAAQVAMVNEEPLQAKVHLTNTPNILIDLEALVGGDQAAQVAGMLDRLDLALREIDDDQFAAQSDLEVLANDLVQLENIYFATP